MEKIKLYKFSYYNVANGLLQFVPLIIIVLGILILRLKLF